MTPNRPQEDRKASQEHELLEQMHRLMKFRAGRRAIHMHLSRLRPSNKRPDRIRIAVNTFEFLVRHFEGQIFALSNSDIVFVCNGGDIGALDDAVMRIRHLFGGDPLTQDFDGQAESRFCSWYDLGRQYDDFLVVTQQLAEEDRRRSQRLSAIAGPAEQKPPELQPLNPRQLSELIDAIERADLSNMMRRQAICGLPAGATPQPMFRELYISIDQLRSIVMPDYNITADRWLFQHLTRTLDVRMLQLLSKNDDRAISASYSININVATLLSDRFLAFDAGLSAATRGTIVFELQPIDVFADLGAFMFARDFVKERGYRVCLDGVTNLTLPFVDRERLGIDLVKIIWQQDALAASRDEHLRELRDFVTGFGKASTILCRCDSEAAIAVGRALGIGLFQGHHVDRLLLNGGSYAGQEGMQKLRAAAAAHATLTQGSLGPTGR
ncbi:MAG: EAL domain-containing protein [Alphaproteobacteria bacterium]|nr:EAL domain-containing protein [Alphaproteobacteria bacterium]